MSFNSIYKGKKVIVTGNTGFKGAWLSIWLLDLGAEVYGISNAVPTEPSIFEEAKLDARIKHQFIDIRDKEKLIEAIVAIQPDFVFHLAAQPIVVDSYNNPVDTFSTNVMGTVHVLEALRMLKNNCNAVIITSDKCYDNVEWVWGYKETDALGGKDPYSASKGAAEIAVKTYYHSYFSKMDSKIKIASVRAGNVIGGGDWAANRIVPDCVRAWSKGNAVEIRNPKATRPWQHVLEPLSGYLRTGELLAGNKKGIHGEAFNFGPKADQDIPVIDLLKAIADKWTFHNDEHPFIINEVSQYHEAGLLKLNCDKALYFMQWTPTLHFNETAEYTATWYQHYYQQSKSDIFEMTLEQIHQYTATAKNNQQAWALV